MLGLALKVKFYQDAQERWSEIEKVKAYVAKELQLKKNIDMLRMDVTSMAFCDNSFDCVVNFTGWEDFTAISGEESPKKPSVK